MNKVLLFFLLLFSPITSNTGGISDEDIELVCLFHATVVTNGVSALYSNMHPEDALNYALVLPYEEDLVLEILEAVSRLPVTERDEMTYTTGAAIAYWANALLSGQLDVSRKSFLTNSFEICVSESKSIGLRTYFQQYLSHIENSLAEPSPLQ